jgi:hypothetical protein
MLFKAALLNKFLPLSSLSSSDEAAAKTMSSLDSSSDDIDSDDDDDDFAVTDDDGDEVVDEEDERTTASSAGADDVFPFNEDKIKNRKDDDQRLMIGELMKLFGGGGRGGGENNRRLSDDSIGTTSRRNRVGGLMYRYEPSEKLRQIILSSKKEGPYYYSNFQIQHRFGLQNTQKVKDNDGAAGGDNGITPAGAAADNGGDGRAAAADSDSVVVVRVKEINDLGLPSLNVDELRQVTNGFSEIIGEVKRMRKKVIFIFVRVLYQIVFFRPRFLCH